MAGFVFKTSMADQPVAKAGLANATVKGAKYAHFDSSGNDGIKLRWELDENDPATDKPISIFDQLVFTPDAAFRIKNYYEAVGRDFSTLNGVKIDEAFLTNLAEEMLGDTATLDIFMKPPSAEYRAKAQAERKTVTDQPNVKRYLPYGSAKTARAMLDID